MLYALSAHQLIPHFMFLLQSLRSLFRRSKDCQSSSGSSSLDSFLADFAPRRNSSISTPESAMAIAAVYRCVDILSGTIASLDLQHQKKDRKVFIHDETSPLSLLFSGKANDRQNFFTLLQNAIIRLLLSGNAYLMPRFDRSGQIDSLILLSDGAVSYDPLSNRYHISDPVFAIAGDFPADAIIHPKNKSLDGGYTGVSTIRYAALSLSLSANADRQTNDGLLAGNQKSGFLVGGNELQGIGALSEDVSDRITARVNREIQAGQRIIRLSGSMQFIESSMSNSDAELLEVRKYSVLDVCRFFGVHPYMVFADQSTNYKEAENSQINFLNQTLRPFLRQIEQEFTDKLLPRSRRQAERIRFDLSALFATDLRTRAEYVKSLVESGVMTPNEGRQFEGRAPLDGGDTLFVSCNIAPIDSPKIQGKQGEIPLEE